MSDVVRKLIGILDVVIFTFNTMYLLRFCNEALLNETIGRIGTSSIHMFD